MRGRRRRAAQGEAFGTSLADILTTALGCVVLLFLVAVTRIRDDLQNAQATLQSAQSDLVAEEEGRKLAEQARQVEQGKRTAVEQAMLDALAARGEAERALKASEEKVKSLSARIETIEEQTARLTSNMQEADARNRRLAEGVRSAVTALDPRTAEPVDVMLVIDGTKSMGPSLDATRRNLGSVVKALRVVSPTARVGVVVFRDKRERKALRIQNQPLTANVDTLRDFLAGIEATSTAVDTDRPEWLCGGLREATEAKWRENAIRLVIVVSDATDHDRKAAECLRLAQEFHAAGGRISVMSTLPEGMDRRGVAAEYADRVLPQHASIAAAGGGTHVSQAEADALLTEVLQSAYRSRTSDPVDALRRVLDEGPPGADPSLSPVAPEPVAPSPEPEPLPDLPEPEPDPEPDPPDDDAP